MIVGILGLGLIGGSMARAYSMAGHRVYAYDRSEDTLSLAILQGAVQGRLDEDVIPQCELILLAIYPRGSARWLRDHAGSVAKTTLVMDLCGTKGEICRQCFPLAQEYGFSFVGGHPMAGSHFSGFSHSRGDLFQGAPMVLVPPEGADPHLAERAKAALSPCGFEFFSVTTAGDHDKMIAFTSQMPHILSNAFIKSPTALGHRGFSAGSYKDLTRVASLNPGMWTELFLENKENLIYELDTYVENILAYRQALALGEEDRLTALLQAGSDRKQEVDG